MSYYSMPASANYNTAPSYPKKERGHRICDTCNAVEPISGPKFRLCGGCMITQYCSEQCQKMNWQQHRALCKHTAQMRAMKQAENQATLVKDLRRFTSQYLPLLGWAGFQALELKRVPANIRQNALLIELEHRNHPESHLRFTIGNTHIVPRSYISDPVVNQDIQRREQRCRHAGGLGAIVIILQCGGMSQVVPVEVDPPSQLSWDIRDDWEEALEHCVEIGKTDFKPISTTPRGIYYG